MMTLSKLTSLQTTIQNLKEIVDKTQGSTNESAQLVKQMEQIVAEMELKARTSGKTFLETDRMSALQRGTEVPPPPSTNYVLRTT